jgi:hypothetical protein
MAATRPVSRGVPGLPRRRLMPTFLPLFSQDYKQFTPGQQARRTYRQDARAGSRPRQSAAGSPGTNAAITAAAVQNGGMERPRIGVCCHLAGNDRGLLPAIAMATTARRLRPERRRRGGGLCGLLRCVGPQLREASRRQDIRARAASVSWAGPVRHDRVPIYSRQRPGMAAEVPGSAQSGIVCGDPAGSAVDGDRAAVREDPLRASVAKRDADADDGLRVIPADDLHGGVALLGAQPGTFGGGRAAGEVRHRRAGQQDRANRGEDATFPQ